MSGRGVRCQYDIRAKLVGLLVGLLMGGIPYSSSACRDVKIWLMATTEAHAYRSPVDQLECEAGNGIPGLPISFFLFLEVSFLLGGVCGAVSGLRGALSFSLFCCFLSVAAFRGFRKVSPIWRWAVGSRWRIQRQERVFRVLCSYFSVVRIGGEFDHLGRITLGDLN